MAKKMAADVPDEPMTPEDIQLLDEFATQAMPSFIAGHAELRDVTSVDLEIVAVQSYFMASAMLTERKKWHR